MIKIYYAYHNEIINTNAKIFIVGITLGMKLLLSTLTELSKSDEYIIVMKDIEEKSLEYGIPGHNTKKIRFESITEDNFWDFVYSGILITFPNLPISSYNFMKVKASQNIHSSLMIQLSEKLSVMVLNNNHKYDEWIEKIYNEIYNTDIKNELSKNNFDNANIDNVDEMIACSNPSKAFHMLINESGNDTEPIITEENRKTVVKKLIK